MAERLRFEVLGPVRAWRGEGEVELGPPQQRAILAVLLLQGGTVVTPDSLVAALWGGAEPRAAVGVVRSYVSRLRRVLESGSPGSVIQSLGGGYAIRPESVGLDLAEFERLLGRAREARRSGDAAQAAAELREALGLWHGTPFAGVNGDFAEAERVRLTHLRQTAIEDLAAADIESGRHVEAAAGLAAVIAEQPLRERPRELLMLALYRSGRQADALAVYAEAQRLLGDELGLDPGPALREMQRRILVSDPALLAPAQPAPAPAPPRRPAQLPPDVPYVIGRDRLRAQMAETLTGPGASVPVIGVEGLAGIGKTALAVHVGHTVAADFPDGQVFVDLGAAADPLAELLRGLGAAGLPESPGERASLWRTLTTGRRLLIVLDDARDARQVLPLLPGAGGPAVLITARRRMYGLPYARWMKLDGLAQDDATTLLERLIGADRTRREPEAVRELIRHTAGLPQIIHAVGARIASRPGWSVAEVMRHLGPPAPGSPVSSPECEAIEGPYESAVERLSLAEAEAFHLLALVEEPVFSLSTASAALNLPPDSASALLESLVDAHLLESAGPDRYHYQEPLRIYARSRAGGMEAHRATTPRLLRLDEVRSGHLYAGAG